MGSVTVAVYASLPLLALFATALCPLRALLSELIDCTVVAATLQSRTAIPTKARFSNPKTNEYRDEVVSVVCPE